MTLVSTVRVQELARSWDGLATITHKLSAEVDGDDVPHEVISQLIEEAVVNSIKHGRAKKIHIQASPSAGAIKVEIHDDGTLEEGPKGSGLGSILFDTFTDGWSLGRSENKTVLKFSILKSQEG